MKTVKKMKDKKQIKTAPKPKADPEQRNLNLKRMLFIAVSIILILSWVLGLAVNM